MAADIPRPPSLFGALKTGTRRRWLLSDPPAKTVSLIAEVKRSSPSKGSIAPDLDAVSQAQSYVKGGAAAVSVLTEPHRFGGSLRDLAAVAAAVRVPVLRKDFIVHPVQIAQACAYGAAAVLFIVRALSPTNLPMLTEIAARAGIDAVYEVRDEWELERALEAGAIVIGVNNRNLETLEIDPTRAPALIPLIPPQFAAIAESGMQTVGDARAAVEAGADGLLIGSALSASADPLTAVRGFASMKRQLRTAASARNATGA